MRIESIELSWFRGAGDAVVLTPQDKSLVVYGANGAGKSSFADALEYLLSDGRIGHLSHEYSGSRQQHGLRNTHAPPDTPSRIGIRFQDSAWLQATIQPDGAFAIEYAPPDLEDRIGGWDTERTILRQDEVARFIHATKGEKYSALLPLLGLEPLEQAAVNLRALQKSLADRGKLGQKEQRLADLGHSIGEHIPDLKAETGEAILAELVDDYLPEGAPDDLPARAAALAAAIQSRINQTGPDHRRYMILQQLQGEGLGGKLIGLEAAEQTAEMATSEFIDRRLAVLEPARDYLDALEAGQETIECPACGGEIAASQFAAHVQGELQELNRARSARSAVIRARQNLQAGLGQLRKLSLEADFNTWINQTEQSALKEALDRLVALELSQCEYRWEPEVWQTLRSNIPLVCAVFENALHQAPPSTGRLFQDAQIVAAIGHLPELYALEREIEQVQILINTLIGAETALREDIKSRTRAIMDTLSGEVQRLWSRLHPNEPIEKVGLYLPGEAEKAIDICLKFYGVDQPSPRLTLSEGHRNSLGLCIFLALVSLEREQERPVILDDVVSSLDREHRSRLARVLQEDFAGRQIILLTHDREWYAELRTRLPGKKWGFLTLRPWEDPLTGIQWSQSKDTFDDARSLISTSPEAAGNRARAIMDTHLALYAERLQVRVPYVRGDRNDRRTCIEFLERITSQAKSSLLKKDGSDWLPFPDPLSEWREVHALLVSWGNRASHTGSLTRGEAEELIRSCEKSLLAFRCPACKEPVWYAGQANRDRLQCLCGDLMWKCG